MTGLVLLAVVAGVAGVSAVGVVAVACAARRRDALGVASLSCDVCGGPVSAEVAHRPHERDCLLLDGCRCDRFTCLSCCDDLACRALTEGVVA